MSLKQPVNAVADVDILRSIGVVATIAVGCWLLILFLFLSQRVAVNSGETCNGKTHVALRTRTLTPEALWLISSSSPLANTTLPYRMRCQYTLEVSTGTYLAGWTRPKKKGIEAYA